MGDYLAVARQRSTKAPKAFPLQSKQMLFCNLTLRNFFDEVFLIILNGFLTTLFRTNDEWISPQAPTPDVYVVTFLLRFTTVHRVIHGTS